LTVDRAAVVRVSILVVEAGKHPLEGGRPPAVAHRGVLVEVLPQGRLAREECIYGDDAPVAQRLVDAVASNRVAVPEKCGRALGVGGDDAAQGRELVAEAR